MAERLEKLSTESGPERHKLDIFPMGDAFLARYKETAKSKEALDKMKDVVYTILDVVIENTKMFRSETMEAEMPYAVLSLRQVAESVYKKNGGQLREPGETEPGKGKKMEFIASSFQSMDGGNQFGYIELAIHQIIKKLPGAIRSLESGIPPEDYDIYMLGSPTNVMGKMSRRFAEEMERDPLKAMGKIYAEVVEKEIEDLDDEEKNETSLTFTGVSMGSSMAAEAGSTLLEQGKVTQDPRDKDAGPRLTLNLYVPSAFKKSSTRLQVPVGFAAEALYRFIKEPEGARKVVKERKEFLEKLYKVLPLNIRPRTDQEQSEMKRSALNALRHKVIKGDDFPGNVKANEIMGAYDPTMLSAERIKTLKNQRREHGGTLGESMLGRKNKNEREFVVNMSHRIPFFRENEFRRWDALVEALENVQNGQK